MIKLMLLLVLVCCGMTFAAEPTRVSQMGEIRIHGPIDKVFQLFTPKGELGWIPTWKYTPLYPLSGETERDMVFHTDNETTTWSLVRYEPPHVSVYVLMNADLVARIEVECRPARSNETVMKITYVWTALTEKGREHVSGLSGAEFDKKMAKWRGWLEEYAKKQGWVKE